MPRKKIDLRGFSIEDLKAEIERRENEEYALREAYEQAHPDYRNWSKMHRSQGWKPLYNSEPDEETVQWIENWLLPKVVQMVTGINWMRDSYLIVSHPTALIRLGFGEERLRTRNPVVDSLKKAFPTLTDDCFGYKLERVHSVETNEDGEEFYVYEGMWSLNPYRIRKRGAITAERFGV
jgi:hypothetical protein